MSTKNINIYEFKAKFSKYAKEVLAGASLIVSIRNKPFAEFRSISSENSKPFKFGTLKSTFKSFRTPDDFDQPLVDFESSYYGSK